MLLRSEQDIQLEKSIGKLDLYRVSDKYDLPHIYTTNKYTYTPNMESTFNIIKSPSFIPGDTVIITQNEVNVDKNAGLQYISEKDINNNITSASGYHTNIYFKKINPTKYKIKINNSTKPFFLVFSESYHPSWKAYISTGTKNGTWKQIADYENLNVTESQDEQKFFEIKDISQLVGKGVSDKNHFLVNGYANAWYINPEELNVNEDFTVTLYFKPQSYFYVGLIILGIIFIGILGYLYLEVRKKQKYGLGDLDEF
jgi:hypothetical protein